MQDQPGIRGRSLPYREPTYRRRTCNRCGIETQSHVTTPDFYCPDCRPEARALGWLTPETEYKNTYTCNHCGQTKPARATDPRQTCGPCDRHIKNLTRKAA